MVRLIAALFATSLGSVPVVVPAVNEGDVVFQKSRSAQSAAIAAATRSEWTHVGIVFVLDGKPFVLEAVQPVKKTPLAEWVARGEGGRVVVKRPKREIAPEALAKMRARGEAMLGRPYDLRFSWDDEKVYCSELVAKVYAEAGVELGEKKRAKDFEVTPLVRERLGKRGIDPEEWIVSPQSIFEDEDLAIVK